MSMKSLDAAATQLHSWVDERDLSGAVLLTVDGESRLETCFGLADRAARDPISPDSRFGIASVTKMFTAVAVADQVTAGRLSFATAVVDVLPGERRPSTLLPEVTVHHLLCHTSGIADYFEEEPPDGSDEGDYADLWTNIPTHAVLRPADFLPLFADLEPYWPPGVKHWYSNAGYILLGLVLEEVTGRPYTELVQERVFDRAGMAASGFFRFDEVLPDVATGYVRSPDGRWRTNHFSMPIVGGADGGAFSTVGDLDRFLTSYDDGTLLGDLRGTMLHPHADAEHGFHYGYGAILYPDGRFGHGGGDPGVATLIHRWPNERANLVVLCNVEEGAVDVRDLVLEAWRG